MALKDLVVAHGLDLGIETLNYLLSFLHDAQIALVHIICLEEVFGVDASLLKDSDLPDVLGILKLQLRDEILEVGDFGGCLFRLQFSNQVL